MSTRTAVGRAHVNAKLDGFTTAGEGLVIVSDSPEECPLCRPWEGQILAIDSRGLGGDSPATSTVSAATSAGLFHPELHSHPRIVCGRFDPPTTWHGEPGGK